MISFIQLSRLVSKHQRINKNLPSSHFLFIRWRFETKRLRRIKKIINIHYQWSLPDPTPSTSSLKINFQISDFEYHENQFFNASPPSSFFTSIISSHTYLGKKNNACTSSISNWVFELVVSCFTLWQKLWPRSSAYNHDWV